MVVVSGRVTHGLDAHLLADATTDEGSAGKTAPLHGAELTAAEVSCHAGSGKHRASKGGTSKTHGQCEGAPATSGLEELLLGEEVSVR